jgi:hypothetical protein
MTEMTMERYNGEVTIETDLPDLNTGLLRQLLVWAAADEEYLTRVMAERYGVLPEEWGSWDQGIWAKEIRNGECKSSYCMAGQAVVQGGYALIFDKTYEMAMPGGQTQHQAHNCAPRIQTGVHPTTGLPIFGPDMDRRVQINDAATGLLGITDEEDCLFSGDNSLTTLVSLGSFYARRRGLDLELPEDLQRLDQMIGDDEFDSFLNYENFTGDYEDNDEDPDY